MTTEDKKEITQMIEDAIRQSEREMNYRNLQNSEFRPPESRSAGMAPNSQAMYGYEYGQEIMQKLGKEEAHRRALRGDVIHPDER